MCRHCGKEEMISSSLQKILWTSFARKTSINKKITHPEAQQKLIAYPFPGNVRELKSIMELAVVMSDEETSCPNISRLIHHQHRIDLLNRETTLKEYRKPDHSALPRQVQQRCIIGGQETGYRKIYYLPDDSKWRIEE